MERDRVQLAKQLLAKAECTACDEEALAFALRAYRLLAEVITKHDLEHGETSFGPRRRERRWLPDRRYRSGEPAVNFPRQRDARVTYRLMAETGGDPRVTVSQLL